MRARTLRKKEAFKKQTETQKALGTATAAPMKCEDEKQVADVVSGAPRAPGDVPSATPGVSPVNVGSTAVPKKKVYSVKIEESAENTEMEPR